MNSYDYKDALDYAIVEILYTKDSALRYHELVEDISMHCKIYPPTLTRHLKTLAARNIIERKLLDKGHTTYTLTKRFKEVSEIQRKKYPTNFWKRTFVLEPFDKDTFEFGIPGVPRPRFKTYWPQRDGKYPSWWLPPKKKPNRRKTT